MNLLKGIKTMIKDYLEYRRNKKIAKREIAKIAATTLPVVREVSDKSADIAKFVLKLINETKEINGEEFVKIVIGNIADVLKTSDNRLINIITYMASLSPEEIQKLLVHSMVSTMPDKKDD